MLKHLLFWPITGPNFLARFALEKVSDTVREQLTDDQAVKQELMALQMELELGEIDDAQYVEREAALMQQLREVRHWREQYGMGTSGGPVQVRQEPAPEGPAVAENVVASPEGTDDRAEAEEGAGQGEETPGRGGIASSQGATVELNLDWEE
jgi:hypothetical protein